MRKPIEKRIEAIDYSIAEKLVELSHKDFENNTPEHPFVTTQALLNNVTSMMLLTLLDEEENPVSKEAETVLEKAAAFKETLLRTSKLASGVADIPVVAIALAMAEAANELLDEFHSTIEEDMAKSDKQQKASSPIEDILKGIIQ